MMFKDFFDFNLRFVEKVLINVLDNLTRFKLYVIRAALVKMSGLDSVKNYYKANCVFGFVCATCKSGFDKVLYCQNCEEVKKCSTCEEKLSGIIVWNAKCKHEKHFKEGVSMLEKYKKCII